MFGLSPEQSYFELTNKCPRCRRVLMMPRFILPDGSRISSLDLLLLKDKRAVAHCRKCDGSWLVFVTKDPIDQPPSATDTIRVVETSRVQEAIGRDVLVIDNSGPANSVRRIKVTNKWTQRVEFANDRSGIIGGGGNLLVFKVTAEKALRRHFGVGAETEQTFEEEIELSVPPHTVLELVLHWKRIWQQGMAVGAAADGRAIEVPFRAVVGLTFDQVTR